MHGLGVDRTRLSDSDTAVEVYAKDADPEDVHTCKQLRAKSLVELSLSTCMCS